MKRVLSMALCAVAAAALLTGCEWSTSSDYNESWNDSYNWVNFSGTYRSSSGGMLVTDYTTMSAGGTNNYNISESGGTMASGQTTASGTTRHAPIVPGSFSVVVGEVTLSDNGGGVLSGNGGSGTVSYAGGTWSIKLDSGSSSKTESATESAGYLDAGNVAMGGSTAHKSIVPSSFKVTVGTDLAMSDDGAGKLTGTGVKDGAVSYDGGTWNFTLKDTYASVLPRLVTVEYSYSVADVSGKRTITVRYAFGASNNGSSSGAKAGSSGKPIYSFVVAHQGQNLSITDNNGSVYKGRITKMQSSSGVGPTNSLPRDGDTIIATFSTEGISAANMKVKIAGTFQGVVSGSVFTGRTMQATWIETGGKTGDINGTTVSVAIASPSTTETSSLTITSTTTTTGGSSDTASE